MKAAQLDCLCVTLLHLLHTAGSERFEVLGPTDPIVAVAGDDIILPCYLKPNISAEDMTVDWLNLDFLDGRVFRYQKHRIIREDQIPYYRERTSLFEEELWRGNTSLKLTRVQGTDEGRYKCFIKAKSWYDDFTIQVLVKAVGSKPVVSIEGHRDGGMGLLCESEGWHPQPELVWLDSKGVHLSAGPPETHRDFKGFYTVKQHVIVQETDTNHFTCRVQQSRINEKMETEVHLPSELFHHTSPWRMAFIVSCCLGAVTVIGLALTIYCIHNKKGVIIDQLKLQRDDQTKEGDDLKKERDVLREEKANLSAQNNYLTEKSEDLTEQRDDLKKEKDDLRKDKDDLSKEKAMVEKDLTSQLDKLKEEMVNLWARNQDLRKEKDVLTGKLDDLTGKLDDLRKERIDLWAQNNEIREEKANLSAQNNYLTEKSVNLTEQRDDLKKEKDDLRKDKDDLSKEKAMVEKDLTSQLDKLKEEKDDLRKERVDLWHKNNDLKKERDDLKKERDRLSKEKAMVEKDLTSQLVDLKNDREDLKKEMVNLTGKLDDLRKERNDLRKDKDKVEKDLTSKLEELRKERTNLSAQNNFLKEERDRLSKEKDKVEKDLTSKLEDFRNERVNLWDQNKDLTGKLINLTGKREVENNPTSKLVDVTLDPDTASSGKGET